MFSYPFYLFERYDNMHFFFKTNLKVSLFYVLGIRGDIGKKMRDSAPFFIAASAAGMICMLRYQERYRYHGPVRFPDGMISL